MSSTSEVKFAQEQAYLRKVLFAVQLLDAVTLERVSRGVEVVAEGLQNGPIVSAGGVFVWLEQDTSRFRKVKVNPKGLPYDEVERNADELERPLATLELSPRVGYPFAGGVTGARGTLVESETPDPTARVPIRKAEVSLKWLDDEGHWRIAPTRSRTDESGDFVVILRLAADEVPALDPNGAITVRLGVGPPHDLESTDRAMKRGQVSSLNTFALDDMH